MKLKLVTRLKKLVSAAAAVTLLATSFSGSSLSYAAEVTSVSHTYEFKANDGKAVPVKGQVLDGTAGETSGILYSEESTNNVTFDANQLKFRDGSVLYLPIQDDTTKITYKQTCNGDSDSRPTYVGDNTDTYKVDMHKKEQSVTIDDITDYIKVIGNQKYIAIYSHGDVKVTVIKLVEYNPINRVTVTGKLDGAAQKGVSEIVFKNMATDELTTAAVAADGTYSVVLKRVAGNTEYTASISKTGFKLDNTDGANQFTLTGNDAAATVDFKVVEAAVAAVSGTLTGVPDAACKGELQMNLIPEDSTLNTVSAALTRVADGTYTFANVSIVPDMTYSFELVNANDYEIKDTLLKAEGNHTGVTVTATAKPVYDVTGAFVTSDGKSADVKSVTFTNMNEEGYSYTFAVSGNSYTAKLRAGEYVTSAEVNGYTVFDHVSVKDSAAANDVYLEAPKDTSAVAYKAEIEAGKGKEFETIQDAVDYVSRMTRDEGQRVTIKLNDALYREQIIVNTPDITFATDRTEAPVITWYYGIGFSYYSVAPSTEPNKGYYSEKYAVDKYTKTAVDTHWGTAVDIRPEAAGFRAEGITFESSFNRYMTTEEIIDGVGGYMSGGKDDRSTPGVDVQSNKNKERACAAYIVADECEFKNCSFLSSQDTLFTGDGEEHIYFKDCVIEGTTDFICGNGNPVFDTCVLSIYGYSDKVGDGGYITASKAGGSKGYLFYDCTIKNTDYSGIMSGTKRIFLGRPWGAGTKVLYYNTEVESADMVHEAGYAAMSNVKPEDAFYSEYNTHTPDGKVDDYSKRANGTKILTDAEAENVSVASYFGNWTPYYYETEQPPVQSADYSKVDEALAEAAKLVPEEYVDFSAVTAAVNAVVRDLDSTRQAEVDAMAKAITDAIAALQKKQPETQPADYSKVDEALAEAAKLVPEEYVDFAAVTAAINAVVRDLDSTKQTEVDAMAKAITDAIAALQKKQPETQPPTEGETEMPTTPENSTEAPTDSTEASTDSTASGDGVQTGDNSMTSVYLVVMILALAALTFMCVSSKRKQRM